MFRLAEDIEGEQEANTRENAAEVLAAVARSRGCPLTPQLAAPEFLDQLLRHAFGAQQGPTLVQVEAFKGTIMLWIWAPASKPVWALSSNSSPCCLMLPGHLPMHSMLCIQIPAGHLETLPILTIAGSCGP